MIGHTKHNKGPNMEDDAARKVRSRNSCEGFYTGVRSGKHWRLFGYYGKGARFSMQVKALNRKQRKQTKMSEGEM